MAQLRGVIGRSDEELSLRSGCSLVEVFHWIAETHGPSAGAHVLTAHGEPQPGLLVVVNGAAIASVQARQVELKERDTIMLLPPIAGG